MFCQTKSIWIQLCCATIDLVHLLGKFTYPQLGVNKFLRSMVNVVVILYLKVKGVVLLRFILKSCKISV